MDEAQEIDASAVGQVGPLILRYDVDLDTLGAPVSKGCCRARTGTISVVANALAKAGIELGENGSIYPRPKGKTLAGLPWTLGLLDNVREFCPLIAETHSPFTHHLSRCDADTALALHCNYWGRPGDKRPIMEMVEDDLEALRQSVRRKRH